MRADPLFKLPPQRRRDLSPHRRSDASLPVASTAIAHIDYNVATQELTITFARDGSRYTLSGIPEIEAHRMATSASPGKYFNSHIRGKY
jgi:hypothetical protein